MKTKIISQPTEFRNWMSNCKDVFAFDCEATSLDWLNLEIIGFSLCDGTQACYVDIHRRYKKELLMILDFYIGEAKMVVFHSAPFDLMVLRKEGIDV
jgi:DNA polymerase I-like protein with 3'-5' exonuclease and polymerase domains